MVKLTLVSQVSFLNNGCHGNRAEIMLTLLYGTKFTGKMNISLVYLVKCLQELLKAGTTLDPSDSI